MSQHNRKVAVITGGSSGMGLSCAQNLVAAGWKVVVWDRSEFRADDIESMQVDVADYTSVQRAAGAIHGGVDLLINAAGIAGGRAPIADQPPAEWDAVINVNLSGTFYCAHALYPMLAQSKGVVVNIASVAAHMMAKGRAHYAVSKAGVETLTRSLANEWAGDGIRVIAVAPGYVKTPMIQKSFDTGELNEQHLADMHALKRLATADEIAEVIIALAQPPFTFMTGTTVTVDGGFTLGKS